MAKSKAQVEIEALQDTIDSQAETIKSLQIRLDLTKYILSVEKERGDRMEKKLQNQ